MKSITKIGLLSLMILMAYSCKKDTKSAVKGEAAPVAEATGKTYNVSTANSVINWKGSKIAGSHTGTFKLSNGTLNVEGNKITGGEFTIDIKSIKNTDMAAGEGKEDLEGHLLAADFFDAAKYPTAKFEITKVTSLAGQAEANALVYGNLTLKEVTKEIGFKAQTKISESGVSISTPTFKINRTDFGMKYGSASFFDNLKDKAINDEVELSISLTAK